MILANLSFFPTVVRSPARGVSPHVVALESVTAPSNIGTSLSCECAIQVTCFGQMIVFVMGFFVSTLSLIRQVEIVCISMYISLVFYNFSKIPSP